MPTVAAALAAAEQHGERFTAYVDTVYARSDVSELKKLADMRKYDLSTLEKLKVFYVGKSGAALMLPSFREDLKGFGVLSERNRPVFYDRYIFPIRNCRGMVVGLVGYSKQAKERYLYARSSYFDRKNMLYGLETLHLVEKLGFAVITEGITDAAALRNIGIENAFATCGTAVSDFSLGQINRRVTSGVICFPDNDGPGRRALAGWNFKGKFVIWSDPRYKDVDEMCFNNAGAAPAVIAAVAETVKKLESGCLATNEKIIRLKQSF
jgi:hypothetical protein